MDLKHNSDILTLGLGKVNQTIRLKQQVFPQNIFYFFVFTGKWRERRDMMRSAGSMVCINLALCSIIK